MDVRFVSEGRGDAVAVMAGENGQLLPAAQALDAATGGRITKAIAAARFTGGAGQVLDLFAPEGLDFGRVMVIGVGALDRADGLAVERWAGHAVKRVLTSAESLVLQPDQVPNVAMADAAARAAFGARMAAYRFDTYRTKLKPDQKPLLKDVQIAIEGAAAARARADKEAAVVEGVFLARDLVSEPPNILYPESYADRLKAELEPLGVEVEILDVAAMEKLGMGALLGVSQGSARDGRLVTMSWKGLASKKARPMALVGKGVTFDTGGISIKPAAGMDEMKGDMGGSAAVAGAMKAIALRKAKANVVGIVALVENMPGSNAQRPGDIVKTMSGQTIEVLNTDAEGRLILADAVWYAQEKFNPTAVIDLATLTGAVVVALGSEYAGFYCNNEDLAQAISHAGTAEGELVWRMPLAAAYDKLIDSPNADMKNIAGKPVAGSIVGAQFIKRFVKDGVDWAHIDIAGTAWKSAPYEDPLYPAWATGYGVRLLNRLVANKYEE